jgi:hypothetical protein
MKAKVTKVVNEKGEKFFYVYSSTSEDNWRFKDCVYIAHEIHEEECLARAMEIASKIESIIPSEEIVYVTPMS